jgi:hypothetical protein
LSQAGKGAWGGLRGDLQPLQAFSMLAAPLEDISNYLISNVGFKTISLSYCVIMTEAKE